MNFIYDLFKHMHWADALMWQSVLATPTAGHNSNVLQQLHHLHLCQHAWLLIWQGKSVDAKSGENFDISELKQWAGLYYEEVFHYLASIEASELTRLVNVPSLEKPLQLPSLSDTFIQITSHSTFHRGQLIKYLRNLGGVPLQTDFIKWVFLGKPNPNW